MKSAFLLLIAAFHCAGQGNEAAAILQKTAAVYKGLASYEFELVYTSEAQSNNVSRHDEWGLRVSAVPPEKWRIDFLTLALDKVTTTRVSDGKSKWVYRPDISEYTVETDRLMEGNTVKQHERIADG